MTSVPMSFGDTGFCSRCTSMKLELIRQIEAFETLLNWNNNLTAGILIQNLREVLKKFQTDNQVPSNTTTLALLPTTNTQLPIEKPVLHGTSRNSSNEVSTTTTVAAQSKPKSTTCSSQKSDTLDTSLINQKNNHVQKKGKTASLTENVNLNSENDKNDDGKGTSEIQPPAAPRKRGRKRRNPQEVAVSNIDVDVEESGGEVNNLNQQSKTKQREKELPQPQKQVQQQQQPGVKKRGRKRRIPQEIAVSNIDVDEEESDGEVINLNQQSKTKKRQKELPQPRNQVQRQQQQQQRGVKKRRRKRKILFSMQAINRRIYYAKQIKQQHETTKVTTDNDNNKDNNINNDGNGEVENSVDDGDDANNNNNNNHEITTMEQWKANTTEMNESPPVSQDHVLSYEKLRQAYSEILNKRITLGNGKMRTIYECLICHKTLTMKMNAALHIRRVHYKDRVSCLDCHQTFYDWKFLNGHHRNKCPAKIGNLRPIANLMSLGTDNQNDNHDDGENSPNNQSNVERDLMKKQATIKKKIQKRRPPTKKNPIKKKKLLKKWKSTISNSDRNEDVDSNISVPIGQRASSPMDLPRKMIVKNASPGFDLKKALNVRVTMERLNLNNLKAEKVQRQQQQVQNSNFNGESSSQSLETNDCNNNEDGDSGDSQLNSTNLFSQAREYSPDIINTPTTFKVPRRSRKSKKNRTRKEMENGTQTDFQNLINSGDTFIYSSSSSTSNNNNNNQIELSHLTTKSNQITQHEASSSYLPILQYMGNQDNVRTATTTNTMTNQQQEDDNLTPPSLKPIPRNFRNTATNTNADEILQQEQDENEHLMKEEGEELTEARLILQQMVNTLNTDSPGSLGTHANDDDTFSDLIDNERIESFSHLPESQEGQYTNICDENLNLNGSDEEGESQLNDDNDENVQEEDIRENLVVDTMAFPETNSQKKKQKATPEEVNSLIRKTSEGLECGLCEKVFSHGKRPNIVQHIRFFHFRERDSECTFCGKIYATQANMLKHQSQCAEIHYNAIA